MPLPGITQVVTNTRKNETYLLYQCGTPNPATAEAGAKVPGLPAAGFKTFQIPLVATAVSDTTVNGFLVRDPPLQQGCVLTAAQTDRQTDRQTGRQAGRHTDALQQLHYMI
jgi:hypothetical protein